MAENRYDPILMGSHARGITPKGRGRLKPRVGSHAQAALTPEQRKSRAKTNRRNARFAFTDRFLRPGGYKGPNLSRSRAFKQLTRAVYEAQVAEVAALDQTLPRPAVAGTPDAVIDTGNVKPKRVVIEYKAGQW